MDQAAETENAGNAQLTVDIVSAYISKNSVRAADLPALIAQVHAALAGLSMPVAPPEPEAEKATPYQIKRSITPDALISFIDGKPYKTLKRHLSTHGLDIVSYRARYGLPADYPTVSATYSAARSAMAHEIGLGQLRRRETVAPALPPVPELAAEASPPPTTPPRRGRPKKAAEPVTTE